MDKEILKNKTEPARKYLAFIVLVILTYASKYKLPILIFIISTFILSKCMSGMFQPPCSH